MKLAVELYWKIKISINIITEHNHQWLPKIRWRFSWIINNTFIENDKELISCIASFYNKNVLTKDNFVQGFKMSLWSLIDKKKEKGKYSYLAIEDISDNNYIIENIKIKTYIIFISLFKHGSRF